MAWEEELFAYLDDLEQQAAALYDAERRRSSPTASRAEYQQVTLAGRLMASVDLEVTLELAGVGAVSGRLDRVADGWCVLSGHGQDWVVRIAAVAAAHGLSERAVPEVAWPVGRPARPRLGAAPARRRRGAVLAAPASTAAATTAWSPGSARTSPSSRRAGRLVLVAFDQLAAVQSRR